VRPGLTVKRTPVRSRSTDVRRGGEVPRAPGAVTTLLGEPAPAVAISRRGGVRQQPLNGAANGRRPPHGLALFGFQHVRLQRPSSVLLSWTEYPSCAVFLLQDRYARRVYRLYDFSKTQRSPMWRNCIAGKVNRADKLHLVIESVRPRCSIAPSPADGLLLTAREGATSQPHPTPNSTPSLTPFARPTASLWSCVSGDLKQPQS
jgi:hypothetical protein